MKLIIDIDEYDFKRLQWTTIGKTGVDHEEKMRNIILAGVPYEERPQGEWIETEWFDEIWGLNKECPFCHKQILSTHYNFCGNCGADMRGNKE